MMKTKKAEFVVECIDNLKNDLDKVKALVQDFDTIEKCYNECQRCQMNLNMILFTINSYKYDLLGATDYEYLY